LLSHFNLYRYAAANLEKLALPTVEDIVRVAKRVCYK
jgi:hypothetical protein